MHTFVKSTCQQFHKVDRRVYMATSPESCPQIPHLDIFLKLFVKSIYKQVPKANSEVYMSSTSKGFIEKFKFTNS